MSYATETERPPIERPQEGGSARGQGLENVDRIALMQEARRAAGSQPKQHGDAKLGAAKPPGAPKDKSTPHFSDIYRETGVVKTAKGETLDSDAGGVSVGKRSPAERDSPASLRSRPEKVDPNKRNALVLDQFKDRFGPSLEAEMGTKSHGGAIADGMRANGFNTYTADLNPPRGANTNGEYDFGASFRDVAKKIDNGQIPLRSGDVITASFGRNAEKDPKTGKVEGGDPTFAQASNMLKMQITPDTVQGQSKEIIDRLGKVAQGLDPETGKPTETDPKDRVMAGLAYDSNKAIQDLQRRGITVMAAAGNDGPDRLSLDSLAATRLSSAEPSGKLDGFSASDSATKSANGVVSYNAISPNMFDKTPLKNQRERVQADGTGAFIGTEGFGRPTIQLDRGALGPDATTDNAKAITTVRPDLSQTAFQPPDAAASKFSKQHLDIPPLFTKTGNPPGDVSKVTIAKVQPGSSDGALTPPSRLVGVDPGTSFSVIDFTKGKADRSSDLFGSSR